MSFLDDSAFKTLTSANHLIPIHTCQALTCKHGLQWWWDIGPKKEAWKGSNPWGPRCKGPVPIWIAKCRLVHIFHVQLWGPESGASFPRFFPHLQDTSLRTLRFFTKIPWVFSTKITRIFVDRMANGEFVANGVAIGSSCHRSKWEPHRL